MRTEEMKYYRPANWDGNEVIHAFLADGSQDSYIKDGFVLMTDQEVDDYYERLYAPAPEAIETAWRDEEYAKIPEYLLMIEDGDPDAPFGTIDQWKLYRIALRRWKEGAEGWPDSANRPARPA